MPKIYKRNSEKILNRINEDYRLLESKGYEVVGVFLQGSQNYNLDYEGSDIDTKAIVLPSFHDLIFNTKPVSTTLILPSNEHKRSDVTLPAIMTGEHIDVKDARVMFELWRKQNINFTEVLFSQAYVLNPKYENVMQEIINSREYIAHANTHATISCIVGVMHEKQHAMTHPYPAVKDKIDKYFYDPKQLHHIIRLKDFMTRYAEGELFESALIANDHDYLIQVKAIPPLYNINEALKIADKYVDWADKFKKEYFAAHEKQEYSLDNIFNKAMETMLKRYYTEEFGKEEQLNFTYNTDDNDER